MTSLGCEQCQARSCNRDRHNPWLTFAVSLTWLEWLAMPDDWMFHGGGKTAPRQPKPGERLFEFVRASDRAPMSCWLRFHGETYGWEAKFVEQPVESRGDVAALYTSRRGAERSGPVSITLTFKTGKERVFPEATKAIRKGGVVVLSRD